MPGKTIQIFLPNGNPKGVKKASVTTDKIEIIQIPRKNLIENNRLLDFNGVYILVDSLNVEKPEIYIGKGNIKSRTYSHDSKKDFWNSVFAIRLKEEAGFNDAHNSYLEYYFIKNARDLGRSIMNENKQQPNRPSITEEIESEILCYIDTIKILLSTLGLKCFEKIENETIKKKNILLCQDKYGDKGEGEYTEEGFLVYKGAKCKKDLHPGTKKFPLRENLILSGILKEDNGYYVLQENKLFSVSAASSIILGRNSNGWIEWKNAEGKTLDELERNK